MRSFIYFFLGLLILSACNRRKEEQLKTPPAVKNFWPNSGKPGTIVTINGAGFGFSAKDNEVSFNGTSATVVDVKDTVMTVLAPEKGSTGKVSVSTGGKQIDAGTYTYQDLSMRGVSPLNGPAGTNLLIRGEGFSSTSSPAKVMVNGKEAIITTVNDTTVIAAVPEGAGSGPVKVVVDDKEVTGPAFLFQNISKIKPLQGGKGTHVIITGEGFSTSAADNSIAFNGKPGAVISATATQLMVATPDDVATGPLSVTINGQKTVGPVFTVIPPPQLSAVAPLSSPAGRDVTINGNYFSAVMDENVVSFNGVPGVVKSATDKELVITVPAGAGSGNMKVWVNGQETGGPLFKEQNLGIIKLTPDNGLGGTVVTVTGIGFSTNISENIATFNGTAAEVVSATATELKVKAPATVTTGTLNVKVSSLEATGPVFKRAGVITLFGGPGTGMFAGAKGLVGDRAGNLYFLQQHQISKITPNGTVSVYTGSTAGHTDGDLADARFQDPMTITVDALDNLYVLDGTYQRSFVRKITPSGAVSTILSASEKLPGGIGVDSRGTVYVSKQYQGVWKVEANGTLSRVSPTAHTIPDRMAIDPAGNIYYTGGDYYNPFVMKGNVAQQFNILAGSPFDAGFVDGQGTNARLGAPLSITTDPLTGNMLFIDNMNFSVRMVTPAGMVTTVAGAAGTYQSFVSGYKDGTLKEALFKNMFGIHVDWQGNIFVLDRENNAVRKIFLQ